MRILLIEDDRALCTALLPALQAAGYTVDTCHDGADGKALLCGGAYEVCVLDRMLPGLDGLSLLRAARAKGCTTPVSSVTSPQRMADSAVVPGRRVSARSRARSSRVSKGLPR